VHYQLYEAFGWAMPAIAHLPVILNPNGHGKLSKRTARFMQDGRRVPILVHEFREAGYLPAAVINFLTNIGWSFGEDREVFSVEETIPRFDLSRINPAGGKFPLEKLDWLNGIYIRSLEPSALAAPLREALEASGYPVNVDVLRRVIPLVQTRLQSLHDVVEMAGFFFKDSVSPAAADLLQKDMDAETTRATLAVAYDALAALPEFEAATLEQALRALTEKLGLRTDQLFGALRAAITGQRVSPPLFETMAIVGREACLKRIKAAEALL
jgi:glutamyl-tRNA synthetase